jgi:hypothetical protein
MVTVYFDLDAFVLRTMVYFKPFRPFYNPTFAYYVIKITENKTWLHTVATYFPHI